MCTVQHAPGMAYPVSLAKQVAEIWKQQGWGEGERHRQWLVAGSDWARQRGRGEGRASWGAADSLGPAKGEARMLAMQLEAVMALEGWEQKGLQKHGRW